ncbi:MAG: alpha/beta fold hydrolase [Proteobacteria bacterium]|nr:MAG: alpha/beta fold hydrolase [Pseudomonadota bacterium]
MKTFLLHGMGGAPSDWQAVQKHFPAEALALPPAPTFGFLVETLADFLAEQREPYGLVGYSLGGRVAIALTDALLESGKAPCRLALLGAGLGFSSEEERAERREKDQAWAAALRENPSAFWKRWYDQPLFAGFRRLPAETQEAWIDSRLQMSPDALARQWEGWGPSRHPDLRPALTRIVQFGIPTLYLAGELDTKYKLLSEELRQDGILSQVILGAGHLLPLEAPEAVGLALRDFFVKE